jgi:hypothetical protein
VEDLPTTRLGDDLHRIHAAILAMVEIGPSVAYYSGG